MTHGFRENILLSWNSRAAARALPAAQPFPRLADSDEGKRCCFHERRSSCEPATAQGRKRSAFSFLSIDLGAAKRYTVIDGDAFAVRRSLASSILWIAILLLEVWRNYSACFGLYPRAGIICAQSSTTICPGYRPGIVVLFFLW